MKYYIKRTAVIKGKEAKNNIKGIHPGRSVVARLCRLGIARPVVTTGSLVNVGTIGLLTAVTWTGLVGGVTIVFIKVVSLRELVVASLVGVTSVGILVVPVLVKVWVRGVGSPGLPIVMGGGGGPLHISPTGQQPPPSQQTVLWNNCQ